MHQLTTMALQTLAQLSFGGDITLASDYVFRGVSQTMSEPALHGSVYVEHDAGWYGELWASNVDFTANGDPDDGARIEVDVEVGLSRQLSERLSATIGFATYAYPGTRPGYDYDYGEWLGMLAVDDRHTLRFGYSDDVFASGQSGIFYALGTSFDLPADLWLGVDVGHYDLSNAFALSYGYGELSLGGALGPLDWCLRHIRVEDVAAKLFYETTVDERTVVSLSFSF